MHHSIHVARWIDLIADLGWELHMFPVDGGDPNPNLRGVALHWPVLEGAPRAPPPAAAQPVTGMARLRRAVRAAARDPGWAVRRVVKGRAAGPAPLPVTAHTPTSHEGEAPVRRLAFMPTLEEIGGVQAMAHGAPIGAGCVAPAPFTPGVLASVIRRVQPDLIHSMEFQHAGYLVQATKEIYGPGFPPWLATNWGSDIFLFGRQPEHAARIREVLASIDLYSCECHRDVTLAREFGYAGHALPVLTNTGGFDMAEVDRLRSPLPPSQRKLLMIKGYHHFAGRAMTALAVLERYAARLKDYEIVLYSVSAEPRQRALALKDQGILNIRVIDWATHEDILANFGRARLYMAISLSDAISTSVLESMAMGAFPIQTNTACCEEWFTDGESGFAIPPDDFEFICDRFERALSDDALVDRAAEMNYRTIKARLDLDVLKPRVEVFYDEAFATVGAAPQALRSRA